MKKDNFNKKARNKIKTKNLKQQLYGKNDSGTVRKKISGFRERF